MDPLFDVLLPLYAGTNREKKLLKLLGGDVSEQELEEERQRRELEADPLKGLFDLLP